MSHRPHIVNSASVRAEKLRAAVSDRLTADIVDAWLDPPSRQVRDGLVHEAILVADTP